jgi:hypothetical protein
MSLYAKSWLFTAWIFGTLVMFPVWQPFLQNTFGSAGSMIGLTLCVSQSFVAMFLFACPDCRFSLFTSDGSFFQANHPWPNKMCSRCGRDHSC